MGTIRHDHRAARRNVRLALAPVALLCGALAACDGFLEVDLPTRVRGETLDDPALAAVILNSAIGDFECALSNYVPATGMIAGEFRHSTGWSTFFPWDYRRMLPTQGDTGSCAGLRGYGLYLPLHTARVQAQDLLQRLDGEWKDMQVPERTTIEATAAAYAGYSLTLLGEGFCQVTLDGGPAMQPAEALAMAETLFTRAIDTVVGDGVAADILNMARVGRARVRLNLGKGAEAVADAREVPEGFVQYATRSATVHSRQNYVFKDNVASRYITVDPAYRDLRFDGVPDPRVMVMLESGGADDGSDLLQQDKYSSYSAPIPVARWEEAQLIIAEIEGGAVAVDIINELHARAGLPPFSSTDPAAIHEQVIEERRRELFAEGHRLNDMLRLGLPFKAGPIPNGTGNYGSTTCMPLPQGEVGPNPNL